MRVEWIESMVTEAFRSFVLTPEAVERVVRDAVEDRANNPAQLVSRRAALQQQAGKVASELERLTAAVAGGAAVATLLDGIKTRERDLAEIRAKVEYLDGLQKATEAWNSGAFAERVREASCSRPPIFCFPDTAQDGTKRWVFSATGTYGRSPLGVIDSSGADSGLATMKWTNVPRPAQEIRAERVSSWRPSRRRPLQDGH